MMRFIIKVLDTINDGTCLSAEDLVEKIVISDVFDLKRDFGVNKVRLLMYFLFLIPRAISIILGISLKIVCQ